MYKNLRRFYNKKDEERIYFVTIVTKNRIVFFDMDVFKELFKRNLIIAGYFHRFCLYSYTIQKDHIHLLIQPLGKETNISKIIKFIKKNFAHNINFLSTQPVVGADNYPRRMDENNNDSSCKNNNPRRINSKHSLLQKRIIQKHWKYLFQLKITWDLLMIHFAWHKSYYDCIVKDYKEFKRYSLYIEYNDFKHQEF